MTISTNCIIVFRNKIMLIFKVTVRDSFPTQISPLTPSINFGFCKKLWNRYAIFNTKAIKTKVFHSFFSSITDFNITLSASSWIATWFFLYLEGCKWHNYQNTGSTFPLCPLPKKAYDEKSL